MFYFKDMHIRWNAAFLMCQLIHEQRIAIEHFAYIKERSDILAELIDLLQNLKIDSTFFVIWRSLSQPNSHTH